MGASMVFGRGVANVQSRCGCDIAGLQDVLLNGFGGALNFAWWGEVNAPRGIISCMERNHFTKQNPAETGVFEYFGLESCLHLLSSRYAIMCTQDSPGWLLKKTPDSSVLETQTTNSRNAPSHPSVAHASLHQESHDILEIMHVVVVASVFVTPGRQNPILSRVTKANSAYRLLASALSLSR